MTYCYDGSWNGLLSVVFESFRLLTPASNIVPTDIFQPGLFEIPFTVETNDAHAKRVLKGVEKKCGKKGTDLIYQCFLSEQPGIEIKIHHFIRTAMKASENVLHNYRDDTVLQLHKIKKMIGREVHRMHAFVRFQETKDGMLVALINPDFNVLPLSGKHFVDRYPALHWLIYDTKRHYGWHYDQHQSRFITLTEKQHEYLSADLLTNSETDYQALWQTYFKKTDIPERRNMKLHMQHVPKRYWKFLVEKWEV